MFVLVAYSRAVASLLYHHRPEERARRRAAKNERKRAKRDRERQAVDQTLDVDMEEMVERDARYVVNVPVSVRALAGALRHTSLRDTSHVLVAYYSRRSEKKGGQKRKRGAEEVGREASTVALASIEYDPQLLTQRRMRYQLNDCAKLAK